MIKFLFEFLFSRKAVAGILILIIFPTLAGADRVVYAMFSGSGTFTKTVIAFGLAVISRSISECWTAVALFEHGLIDSFVGAISLPTLPPGTGLLAVNFSNGASSRPLPPEPIS